MLFLTVELWRWKRRSQSKHGRGADRSMEDVEDQIARPASVSSHDDVASSIRLDLHCPAVLLPSNAKTSARAI